MNRILRRIALLSATAALSVLLSAPVSATVYLDVESTDWFAPAVGYAVRKDLFQSVAPGLFAPRSEMTRAMFYTVLCRMAGADADDAAATNLTDVPAGRWYTGSVVWALNSGIAQCREETAFGAGEPLTRAELCLALARYDRSCGQYALPEAAFCGLNDLLGLDAETASAIASCYAAGVVQGRGGGIFAPDAGASRGEVAQILQNFCQLPRQEAPADTLNAAYPWDTVSGWTGELHADFPLSAQEEVTAARVLWLNRRILHENYPAAVAPPGTSLDGNPRHLTNYGSGGMADCIDVATCLYNKNNGLEAGEALDGVQEYYGYSLQTDGILRQDLWHQQAQDSGKDPWQCTWWVWGRAAQYLELAHGLDLKAACGDRDSLGHGMDYYRSLSSCFLSDQTPSANSIVSWSCGSYGHVAYVEAVDEGGIWVSMADSGHTWRGVTYIARTDSAVNPYPLNWYPSERLNGFNHLDSAADGSPIS